RGEAQAVSFNPGAIPDDRLLRGQDGARARQDPQTLLGSIWRSRARTGRRSHLSGAVHIALQREFDIEPAARAGDGLRVLLQFLPWQAAAQEGRGDDPDPSLLR